MEKFTQLYRRRRVLKTDFVMYLEGCIIFTFNSIKEVFGIFLFAGSIVFVFHEKVLEALTQHELQFESNYQIV
jgi:hypothetical protein